MQQTQNDDKQSEARQSAEERRDPQRKHIAHTKRRAAMRRCGDAGGDAAAMLPQCGGPSRESGRSAAKRGEARRSAAKRGDYGTESPSDRGEARPSAAKRGEARPSAAKTLRAAPLHTQDTTHTQWGRGDNCDTQWVLLQPLNSSLFRVGTAEQPLYLYRKWGLTGKKSVLKCNEGCIF